MGENGTSTVALVRCQDYIPEQVDTAVQKGLELLGGAGRFAAAGEKILLKPNILEGADASNCISPHPIVFASIAREFQKTGAKLRFGDSPGVGSPEGAVRRSGHLAVAQELGIELADFNTAREVPFPEGHLINKFEIAEGVMSSDGLVSISKLKTHALTRITGAIKNQFGCIPGARKAEFHSVMPNASLFSQMLADLNLLLKPRLFIMDGIIAMEGNGPRNGTPRPMHVLLFSTDPVALDATVCRLIDLDPSLVEPLVHGEAFGLGTTQNIEYIGDPLESFIQADFKANRSHLPTTTDHSILSTSLMRRFTSPRPVIDPTLCIRCGQCVNICPAKPKALSWRSNERIDTPVYDYAKCIRCYCCQETCPEKAISVEIPWLGRLVRR
jgi:uncharacterized protein (DUF362 family)/NAD-dependent dihydropyrimidine dehydrogenase PreA subunit